MSATPSRSAGRVAAALGTLLVIFPLVLGGWLDPVHAQTLSPRAKPQPLEALDDAESWLNSPPLTGQRLKGRVVLVDFWTYSCINCLRTLPHVKNWARKYGNAGLVVVGVHSPEFNFEKAPDNLRKATAKLGIEFPVVLDNDFRIWRAFGNQAWPGFYFVDAQGRVRHQQYGEGNYGKAEAVLRQLLKESNQAVQLPPLDVSPPNGEGTQAAPSDERVGSNETYLGSERASGFANTTRQRDKSQTYEPQPLRWVGQWTLQGDWAQMPERIELAKPGGRLIYRFHARDVHLVLGPTEGQPVRFKLRIDGKAPGDARGTDVDAAGMGVVDQFRLYQLVRRPKGAAEGTVEIEFLDAGVQAYAFTFG